MKRAVLAVIAPLLLLLLLFQVFKEEDGVEITPTPSPTTSVTETAKSNTSTPDEGRDASDADLAEIGQPFQLSIGQSALINGLVITFVAVGEDSRCPRGVMCVWAGRVKVLARVQKDGETLGEFELTAGELAGEDVNEVELDGFVLRLVAVEPYPVAGEQTDEGDYVAEMVVE